MKRNSLILWTVQVLLWLAGGVAWAAPPLKAFTGEDHRLTEKKVTTQVLHVYVGELLEQWQKQTGVPLSADTTDGAADEEIAVWVRDMPLSDAMNAVWSLVSYQGYEWKWERTGSQAAYRYVLHQGGAGKRFRRVVAASLTQQFSDEAALLMRSATLTETERSQVIQQNPALAAELKNPFTLDSFRIINGLTDAQRATLLEKRGKVTIPLGAAGETAQRLATKYVADFQDLNPGQEPPHPAQVQFGTEPFGVSQVMFIGFSDATGGTDRGFFGGMPLEKRHMGRLRNLWVLGGESSHADVDKAALLPPLPGTEDLTVVPEGETKRERSIRLRTFLNAPQAYRLQRLAASLHTPIMARLLRRGLSSQRPFELVEPAKMTLEAFLSDSLERGVDHKWSGGALLFASHLRAFNEKDAQTEPWALVGKARAYQAASPAKVLSLEQAAEIAAETTPETLERLVILHTDHNLTGTRMAQEMLTVLHRDHLIQQVQTDKGVPYARVAACVNKMLTGAKANLDGVMSARIRTVSEPVAKPEETGFDILFRLEILNGDGNVLETLPLAGQRGTQAVAM